MSPLFAGTIGIIVLFIFLFAGVPVAFSMALVGVVGFAWLCGLGPTTAIVQAIPYTQVANYIMSVVPLFLLMGAFAFTSGLTEEAYKAGYKWLGHLPGGLAMATIAGCAGFAAVCGSSVAAGTTMTQVAWPEMRRYKYDPKLGLGCIAAGGTLGILIPPSIPMIVYATFAEESVGKLFIGGILPGILLSTLFIVTIYVRAKWTPSMGPGGPKASWGQRMIALKDMWTVVLLFLIVMGGIWGGIFSPSEAAGVGAFAALLIGLAKKRFTKQNIILSFKDALRITAMVFFLIIGAMLFNSFLVVSGLSTALKDFVVSLPLSATSIMVAILFIYLILGCVMDTFAMTVLTLPLFIPILRGLGIDIVWFGILYVVMAEMALITPPIGVNVFVLAGVASDVPVYTIFRGIAPFVLAMIICLVILIAFPQIALFLPSTMIG